MWMRSYFPCADSAYSYISLSNILIFLCFQVCKHMMHIVMSMEMASRSCSDAFFPQWRLLMKKRFWGTQTYKHTTYIYFYIWTHAHITSGIMVRVSAVVNGETKEVWDMEVTGKPCIFMACSFVVYSVRFFMCSVMPRSTLLLIHAVTVLCVWIHTLIRYTVMRGWVYCDENMRRLFFGGGGCPFTLFRTWVRAFA